MPRSYGRLFGLWLAVLSALSIVPVLAQPADGRTPPALRIVSPGENAYISGPTLLKASIEPVSAVTMVSFFADGREVCSIPRPPFQCDWDAGPAVVAHDIRVVFKFPDGRRSAQTVRTKSAGYSEAVDVQVVQVTVAVTHDGRFVHGLPASAFHVAEDGKPQTITGFADSTAPLDLIVAVDVSGSMAAAMPHLKTAVKEFLAAVPEKDHVTLVGFNDRLFPLLQRATDRDERTAAVDGLAAGGLTALYDVVVTSLDQLGRRAGRKAIIVFTDGEDQGSHVTFEMVERRLQESDATLYMIGLGRGTTVAELGKLMQRLAEPTGGRAVLADKVDQLKDVFGDLLEELSNQYLLGYPPINDRQDGTWRRITVRVDGHYKVRARQGYRARGGS